MKKPILHVAILLVLLICIGCSTSSGSSSDAVQQGTNVIEFENPSWQVMSINYEDYCIVYDLDEMSDFDQFPLSKLVAYVLGSDGAHTEPSIDELYHRFMEAPNIVLFYIALIDDISAKTMLCNLVAGVDVDWYGNTYSFNAILNQYEKNYKTGDIADVIRLLRDAHNASIDRNKNN